MHLCVHGWLRVKITDLLSLVKTFLFLDGLHADLLPHLVHLSQVLLGDRRVIQHLGHQVVPTGCGCIHTPLVGPQLLLEGLC